jgi:hypothetical protein
MSVESRASTDSQTPKGGVTAGQPVVAGLYIAERAGAPMQARDWLDLIPGAGVAGDRYARGLGYWSDPRWPDQEVTLVASEVAAALGVEAGLLRRNVVTAGIDLAVLIGRRFWAGTAELAGVRPCDPCQYLDTLTRPGLARALAGRAGLRARVLRAGRVTLGDQLRLHPITPHEGGHTA